MHSFLGRSEFGVKNWFGPWNMKIIKFFRVDYPETEMTGIKAIHIHQVERKKSIQNGSLRNCLRIIEIRGNIQSSGIFCLI